MKMEKISLILNRVHPTDTYIIGTLAFNGEYFSDTMELAWKDNQNDISCVPKGSYKVIMMDSPHFGRPLPHLIGVSGRDKIMIHDGSFPADTEGCILVGKNSAKGILTQSRDASDRLNALLADCPDISITII